MGLNAIQTYAPWNLHEPTPGNFDFSGLVNITRFLDLVKQNNLYVLFRPGPYIDAEWDNGGLPWWLMKNDGIKMRSSDSNFTNAVQSYYNKLLDAVTPYLYKNGGPILMVQVENEYGNILACDKNYTTWLRDLIWSKLGNDVVLYTTNVAEDNRLECGKVPGTATTIDFSPTSDATIDHLFDIQDAHSNGAPHVCSEYYTDWFLAWGATHANSQSPSIIADNLAYMYHKKNASVNLYLAQAGTNFGFHNGAVSFGAIETAYYVGSPISEDGNITEMFRAIRSFIQNLTDWDYPPTPIPDVNPLMSYGNVTLTRIGQNLISTLTRIQEPCVQSQDPLTFEQIDHGFGFVLYTTTLIKGGTTLSTPNIRDYGYVYLNNVYQGMLSRDNGTTLTISAQAGDVLRILVENRGRLCGCLGCNFIYPPLDKKGLHENITLDNQLLQNWYQCGINLTKSAVDSLSQNFLAEVDSTKASPQPGVYLGQFEISDIQDTYLDTRGWGKGQLFINGNNLGHYWPTAGPQMTLYVPKPYLQQNNTVLLIELTGATQNYVSFINHTIFDFK